MSAGNDKNLNMVALLKAGLEDEIKKVIHDELKQEWMSMLESRVDEKITAIVQRVSIGHLKTVRDMTSMRDELHIYLHGVKTEESHVIKNA